MFVAVIEGMVRKDPVWWIGSVARSQNEYYGSWASRIERGPPRVKREQRGENAATHRRAVARLSELQAGEFFNDSERGFLDPAKPSQSAFDDP